MPSDDLTCCEMITNGSQHVTNVARHLPSVFLHLQMRSYGDDSSLVVVKVVDLVVHYWFQALHDQPAESADE